MKKYVYLFIIGISVNAILVTGAYFSYCSQLRNSYTKHKYVCNEFSREVEKKQWEYWIDKYLWNIQRTYPESEPKP
jgi:hypothetical protein